MLEVEPGLLIQPVFKVLSHLIGWVILASVYGEMECGQMNYYTELKGGGGELTTYQLLKENDFLVLFCPTVNVS